MSDDPRTSTDQVQPTPAGIIAHYCEHDGCEAWGGFGFSRGKNGASHWFCGEHKDEGERYL